MFFYWTFFFFGNTLLCTLWCTNVLRTEYQDSWLIAAVWLFTLPVDTLSTKYIGHSLSVSIRPVLSVQWSPWLLQVIT